MSRPHLVIARAGRNSLHSTWLAGSEPRSWDLYLCPYQDLASQDGLECRVGAVIPGPKWTGLRQLRNDGRGWRNYDYFWLPDDDIFASRKPIDSIFAAASSLSFPLCPPPLHESSYSAHFDTMRNRRCFAR